MLQTPLAELLHHVYPLIHVTPRHLRAWTHVSPHCVLVNLTFVI